MFMAVYQLKTNSFIQHFTTKINWKILKSILSLGLVYAASLLIINLNYKADVFLLDQYSSTYEIGIYSRGVTLTEYLWQIPMILSTLVFARSTAAKQSHQFSLRVCQLLRVSLIFITLGSIVLFFTSDILIRTLFGDAFIRSSKVQQILLPGVLLLTIFKVLNMDLAGRGKPWTSMIAMVPALIINVVLNILWIPTMGADGSAYASLVSYSFAALAFYVVYSVKTGIPLREIISYRASDFDFLNLFKKKALAFKKKKYESLSKL